MPVLKGKVGDIDIIDLNVPSDLIGCSEPTIN